MATILALHETDPTHLDEVKASMLTLGAPILRGIDLGDGLIALVEGSHRAQAAADLGLTIRVELLEYPGDDTVRLCDWLPGLDSDNAVATVTDGRGVVVEVDWVEL